MPELVSSLARLDVPFEVETLAKNPERYLYHPGLGIHRQLLDEAGEVLIRSEAIHRAILESKGSSKELERRIRLLDGTSWLDLLEPYRNSENVRLLPKAV